MNDFRDIDYVFFEREFSTLKDNLDSGSKALVSFFDILNQENISKLESQIETCLLENSVGKSQLKKVFFISVETLQNMLIHGHKNSNGTQRNFFMILKKVDRIEIVSANLINNKSVLGLQSIIDKINSFDDPSALKQYYMDHLENNQISDKGGAGLGFITIAMKSGNKLAVEFKKIDEQFSMFKLISSINLD